MDVETDVSDLDLGNQWFHALNQAYRYGEQIAHAFDQSRDYIGIRHAWSVFINQWDAEIHYLLRSVFYDGYLKTFLSLQGL
jgi:hypothetical protein